MNITCGPYVLEPDGSLTLLPGGLPERIPGYRRIKANKRPLLSYAFVGPPPDLNAETEDLLPYDVAWSWSVGTDLSSRHGTRVFALTREHFDAWMELAAIASAFVLFARLFIGPCPECSGRGWHPGDCHPREECAVCRGTGSITGPP